jgi:hypothetical protein
MSDDGSEIPQCPYLPKIGAPPGHGLWHACRERHAIDSLLAAFLVFERLAPRIQAYLRRLEVTRDGVSWTSRQTAAVG